MTNVNTGNWRTTLFGALGAVCLALSEVFPDVKGILVGASALFAAIAAYFAKDAKTGSPPTP